MSHIFGGWRAKQEAALPANWHIAGQYIFHWRAIGVQAGNVINHKQIISVVVGILQLFNCIFLIVAVNGERAAAAVHKAAAVGVVNVYAAVSAICPQSCHRPKVRNFLHYYADGAEWE